MANQEHRNDSGNTLVLALMLLLLIGGIVSALFSFSVSSSRSSNEGLQFEKAYHSAESGTAWCVGRLNVDPEFLRNGQYPMAELGLGDGSFQVIDATPLATRGQYDIVVDGIQDGVLYRLRSVIGHRVINFPIGIMTAGTGDPRDVTFEINGTAAVGSYDSTVAAFDPDNPGDNGDVMVNGSIRLNGGVKVNGDAAVTGDVTATGQAGVTGTVLEDIQSAHFESVDNIVEEITEVAQSSNDNGNLSSIFGNEVSSVPGTEGYSDLIVSGGRYVVPAGTYYFRKFEVSNGAEIVFDTSDGPVNIVYAGSGSARASENTFTVDGGSRVVLDSGGTENRLTTILGDDTNMSVASGSVFGQDESNPYSGAMTQVLAHSEGTAVGEIEVSSQAQVYARFHSAHHDARLKGNSEWYGSAMTRTFYMAGGRGGPAVFAVDESATGSMLIDDRHHELYASYREYPGAE